MNDAERIFDLEEVRADGWLEELAGESEDFAVACRAIGKRTLGIALIAGVRIEALVADPEAPETMLVKFAVGEQASAHSMPLTDFRRRVGATVLAPAAPDVTLGANPTIDDLQSFIGQRYLLIAALFDLQPTELRIIDDHAMLLVRFGDLERKVAIEDFRSLLSDRVRNEMGVGTSTQHTTVDLSALDQAEDATARQDWYGTISALSPWVSPISMLLRTGESRALRQEIHKTLGQGLGLLGTAFSKVGETDTAKEVLRLGVQWAGDGDQARDLFLRMGQTSIEAERHGEAIGQLRRAHALGSAVREVMPLLARCYAARGQVLASMLCARMAVQDGAANDVTEEIGVGVNPELRQAWDRWVAWIDG